VRLTADQAKVLPLLLEPPYRVLVGSGHNVGKTFLAALLVNWWYDSFDPGVVITTAPTERDVVDLLWTEVRLQRQRVGLSADFIGLRAPEMRTSENHYAKGYTARKGESFQGRHRERMLFVFDECEGVDSPYWITTKTMFKPELGHAWLCIGNPTTTTSQAYLEESSVDNDGEPAWHVVNISALDHPNVTGGTPRVPSAVSADQLDDWVASWCDEVPESERVATDFRWRERWYRPGPIAEARILGRRPSAGTYGVWSDALWAAATAGGLEPGPPEVLPEIGCDVARHGDDYTEIHCRWGACSLAHEAHNGWDTLRTAGRVHELAAWLAGRATAARPPRAAPVRAQDIPLKVDDDGVGGGVVDLLRSWEDTVIAVSAATPATAPLDYPNKRSELWFQTAERARRGALDLSRLPRRTLHELKRQAMAPTYKVDDQGRRVVERKAETKEKLRRSPDAMDALNMAFYEIATGRPPVLDNPTRGERPRGAGRDRRFTFGMK
jgi:hypothetical protein